MDDFSIAAIIISAIAIMANVLLLFLSIRSKTLMNDHRYLFLITPVIDIIHAGCFLLLTPVPRSRDFTFVFMSTGPAQTWWPSGMILMVILCLSTMATLVSVGNNFLYRYITLCRSNLSYIYSSRKHLIIGALISMLPVLNWIAMICFGLWPSEKFEKVAQLVWNNEVVVAQRVYIGLTSLGGIDPGKLFLVIETFAMLLTTAQVSPFCAMQIHRCLKSSSISSRTREMHKKMLLLLSIQISCPTILMNLPLSIMFILFFSGLESPLFISYFVGITMALNPLAGPIITILFVKDYRKLFLTTLRLAKTSSTCVPAATIIKTTSAFK